MEFMKIILGSAKNLLGKKTTQDILKYLASVTLNYASNKFGVNQYKYDPIDMKNMVYQHNMNFDDKIDINDLEQAMNLFAINRFVIELSQKEGKAETPFEELVYNLAKICNDGNMIETYNKSKDNHILKLYDLDTMETTSIADNYEISSGGIYIPDRNINLFTSEGEELANAKNDYLEKRMELGSNVSSKVIMGLLQEYYNRINFDDMMEYYKGI